MSGKDRDEWEGMLAAEPAVTVIPVEFRPHVVIVTKDEAIDLGPDAVGQSLEEVFGDAVPPSLRGAKRYRHGHRWIIGRPDSDA